MLLVDLATTHQSACPFYMLNDAWQALRIEDESFD